MLDTPTHAIPKTPRDVAGKTKTFTVGSYLAERLSQIG